MVKNNTILFAFLATALIVTSAAVCVLDREVIEGDVVSEKETETADIQERELLDLYLRLIDECPEITLNSDGTATVVANNGDSNLLGAGSTGVGKYHEGIIIHLDSGMCEFLYNTGSAAAGGALMSALGFAIGSVIPVFGTFAGTVAMGIIGSVAASAICDYIGQGLDFSHGLDIKIKLIGYVWKIPLPCTPKVIDVIPQV